MSQNAYERENKRFERRRKVEKKQRKLPKIFAVMQANKVCEKEFSFSAFFG